MNQRLERDEEIAQVQEPIKQSLYSRLERNEEIAQVQEPIKQGPYSDLKVAWHIDRIDDLRNKGRCDPVSLQLILSDLCNMSCVWCAYRTDLGFSSELFGCDMKDGKGFTMNPNRMLPREKAFEVILDFIICEGKSITWTGGGEPTVHPNHLELMGYALDEGLDCSMNTNGLILQPGWQDVFSRFSYIRISVDAGNAEEYHRLRQTKRSNYYKVLENVMLYVKGCPNTTIGVGYVVSPTNYVNLYEGVKRIRDTGVAYCRLAAMLSHRGIEPYREIDLEANGQIYSRVLEEVRRCRDLATDTFEVYDLFGDCVEDLGQAQPEYQSCRFQQLVLYIGADQQVYRCCSAAYTKHGKIGDLRNERLLTWLGSEEARKAYCEFDARTCVFCQWNQRNRVINALVDEPEHVNFL